MSNNSNNRNINAEFLSSFGLPGTTHVVEHRDLTDEEATWWDTWDTNGINTVGAYVLNTGHVVTWCEVDEPLALAYDAPRWCPFIVTVYNPTGSVTEVGARVAPIKRVTA